MSCRPMISRTLSTSVPNSSAPRWKMRYLPARLLISSGMTGWLAAETVVVCMDVLSSTLPLSSGRGPREVQSAYRPHPLEHKGRYSANAAGRNLWCSSWERGAHYFSADAANAFAPLPDEAPMRGAAPLGRCAQPHRLRAETGDSTTCRPSPSER